jgi:hypothetical protein
MDGDADADLEREVRLFARYLVDAAPAPDLIERYRGAIRALWPGAPAPGQAALLGFVRRHPWSVGPLDAAAALLDPAGLLRCRILVAAAILETTPAHAAAFLPRTVPIPALLWRLAASGAASALLAAAGLALWPLARRARA